MCRKRACTKSLVISGVLVQSRCILLKSYSLGKLLPSQPGAAALHICPLFDYGLATGQSVFMPVEIFRKNKGRNKCIIRCVPEVRSGKTTPLVIKLVAEDFFLRRLRLSLRSSRSNRA